MQAFGGNSIINSGIYPLPGSDLQKKEGIEDSEELLIKDMLAAGENLNHIEKVKATTSQAQSTFKWCSDLGVEWNWERVGVEGGHSVPREMTTKSGFGSGIVIPEFNKCKELGVPVRTRTYVEGIIREPGGAVLGLKIREGYRFPNPKSGKVKFIKANKGVVFLTKPVQEDKLVPVISRAVKLDLIKRGLSFDHEKIKERFRELTEREKQIVLLLTKGLLNREVGERLGISTRTVEVHRARAFKKLELHTISELIQFVHAAEG